MNRFYDRLASRRTATVGVLLALGGLGAAGCGGGGSTAEVSAVSSRTPAVTKPPRQYQPESLPLPPSNLPGPAMAKAIKKLSRESRGTPPQEVPGGFCEYTNENPLPQYSKNPARLIVDSLCQPPLGYPVGVYEEPSQQSQSVGKVEDGDVVAAHCIEAGESITNVLGDSSASTTWVKITEGNMTGFVPEVNLGYVNDANFSNC